jgi:hypothetical protein
VKMKRKGISPGQSPNVAHDSRSASAFFRRTSGTRTPNSLTCPRPSWFGHIQCPTFTPLPGPIFTKQADVSRRPDVQPVASVARLLPDLGSDRHDDMYSLNPQPARMRARAYPSVERWRSNTRGTPSPLSS